jgi:hypothetical protein
MPSLKGERNKSLLTAKQTRIFVETAHSQTHVGLQAQWFPFDDVIGQGWRVLKKRITGSKLKAIRNVDHLHFHPPRSFIGLLAALESIGVANNVTSSFCSAYYFLLSRILLRFFCRCYAPQRTVVSAYCRIYALAS